MLHKGTRLPPCGGKARSASAHIAPRPISASSSLMAAAVAPSVVAAPSSRGLRPAFVNRAAAFDSVSAAAEAEAATSPASRISTLRLTAEAETAAAAPMVTTRFIVPHFPTKPGQQLFLSGSSLELGEWDPHLALPLEWREGHQHTAIVRLPASRVVQVKLVLKENGQPLLTEEGAPRDVMLMPVPPAEEEQLSPQQAPPPQQQPAAAAAATPAALQDAEVVMAAGPAAVAPRPAGPRLDYQIMCHFGTPDATSILRLPVVLPPKESGDRRVLAKFVAMLDGLKLEPRQYPVVVGSAEELGAWKAEAGVKLMRQVGGYWTRRVELPLHNGAIQAKVVICNPDGQAVMWEPGTANRMLVAGGGDGAGGQGAMHIFVCRWGQPDHTAVVSVPVEYESADKEFIKQLDAAQREIATMRRALTAKSRQCQSLESELAASRRAERALREEVGGLRSDMAFLMQEVEVAQRGELGARQEAAELRDELQRLGANYEQQISFLESKLDEMEAEIISLHDKLATGNGGNGRYHDDHDHHAGNGRFASSTSSSFSSSPGYEREEAPRVMTRSSWR